VGRRGAVALSVAAASLAAGCGSSTRNVVSGGAVPGTTRTVYSILPHAGGGAARDMVLGQKLAIQQAGGRAGAYGLSFVSLDDAVPDPAAQSARAGVLAEQAVHDPQVIAIFGGTSSEAARTSIPLIDAAGVLHLLPGAGYPGFTRRWRSPQEPARFQPSGSGRNLVRLVPDDVEQGRALVDAARRAAGRRATTRIAVEQEPGPTADALRDAVARAAGAGHARIVDSADRADAVVYAGEDPVNAAGVAASVAAAGTPIVLPDAVVEAGVAGRLDPATRRRTVLVSGAPAPDAPAVRALAPAFRTAFGREPGPYAVIGYDAMRAVIAAIDRAGPRDRRRQTVMRAFQPPPLRGFSAYRADGRRLPG
jgi:branched-chain amino acid transport system substrate-binding protein